MRRGFVYLMVLYFLLSGCIPVGDATEAGGETTESGASPEMTAIQIERHTPTDTPFTNTAPASPAISTPTPAKTITPSEALPTPLAPFTANSIGPGQQQAYSFQSGSGEEIIFWLYLPQDYHESQNWPLILSLHGFLGFESNLDKVRGQSPPPMVDPGVEFPFIVISPQATSGTWARYHAPLEELISFLSASLAIDGQAQFLTGLSAGAVGAWQWALASPDRFAGVAPVAGGPSFNRNDPVPEDICQLVDLPIWVAHGEADREAPIDPVLAAVTALEECGSAVVRFTTYSDLNHIDAISKAYAGPELYEWMLSLIK